MSESPKSQNTWFEQELADLRDREARDREQMGADAHGALSARLRAHTHSLNELLRRCPPARAELSNTLVDVARLSAHALQVERTSVWLFDEARVLLRCTIELRDFTRVEATDATLPADSCTVYIAALKREGALAVSAVQTDPRTLELAAYLLQRGVGAVLDIPIVVPGELLGVVRHEHMGGPRQWHVAEIDFASSIASLIALALQTERRLTAEYAARGIEAKYRHLVESLPVTVYSFDYRTFKLDYVSPQGAALGAFSSVDAVLARGVDAWLERIHPDDRERIATRLAAGGPAGGLAAEVSYRICLPSGKTRWIRDVGSVVQGADGRPLSVQGILFDVTEQLEAEASLLEFERRYRSLLESVDMVAVTLDATGRATFVNDAFVQASEYTRDELIGVDWFERVVPQAQRERVRARFLADVARGTVLPRFELEIETRTGKRREFLCANTMLRDADGTIQGTASLGLDVTARRLLDDALLQQTKLESLGRLAAGVAHDFNNLLTVLLGQTSLLREGIGREEPRTYEIMEQALDQASDLTHALLAYGRRQPRKREPVGVDALIEETRPLLEAMTAQRVALSMVLQAYQACVQVDRAELKQVLINLVGNAADALEGAQGAVRISSYVELVVERDARDKGLSAGGEFAVLSVSDDGPGMDAAVVKRIFEPFFTTKREGRGTGLGLAIAHSVVSAAGGSIAVESARGEGTVFRVFLPLAAELKRAPASESALGAVMVVDADAQARATVCRSLQAAGYDVRQAQDIRSATGVLSASRVDMLITSATLEDGSGVTLARSLRSLRPDIRVIMLASPHEVDDTFDGCIAKPIDEARLLPAVEKALRHKAD